MFRNQQTCPWKAGELISGFLCFEQCFDSKVKYLGKMYYLKCKMQKALWRNKYKVKILLVPLRQKFWRLNEMQMV